MLPLGSHKKEEKKANIIRTFPIPNSVEDIKEFIFLAASNVNPKCYSILAEQTKTKRYRITSDAWLAKCDQALNKAAHLIKNQDEFSELKFVVDDVKQQIVRTKIAGIAVIVVPILALICVVVLCSLLSRCSA